MTASKEHFRTRMIYRFILWVAKSETTDGLWIGVFADGDSTYFLGKVRDALELIKNKDTNRYRRVLAEVHRILIVHRPSVGAYFRVPRRCELDADFVKAAAIEEIASAIVHEATHGWLYTRGIDYQPTIRQRVERICTRQEMLFIKRVLNPASPREKLLEDLDWQLNLPEEAWTDDALRKRKVDWLVEEGAPRWIIGIVTILGRLKAISSRS